MDILVRQAHPGPEVPPYRSIEQKGRDADLYRREEGIPWPTLFDDLQGTVHQVYGGLSDPTYLLDADGRVAFYNLWTYAPALHEAIDALLARGGRGVVKGGVDRKPYLLAAVTNGWHGLERGLAQSVVDLELALPGSAAGIWLGARLRPLLAPLTLRAEPLPAPARAALALGAAGLVGLGVGRRLRGASGG